MTSSRKVSYIADPEYIGILKWTILLESKDLKIKLIFQYYEVGKESYGYKNCF